MVAQDWNDDIDQMPTEGEFQVLQVKRVFRHEPNGLRVIDPITGRVFIPHAWRPLPKEKKEPKR